MRCHSSIDPATDTPQVQIFASHAILTLTCTACFDFSMCFSKMQITVSSHELDYGESPLFQGKIDIQLVVYGWQAFIWSVHSSKLTSPHTLSIVKLFQYHLPKKIRRHCKVENPHAYK